MKLIGLCLLFAVAIQSFCRADVTKLSSEDPRVLQDSSRFHEVRSTTNLPSAILALCDSGGNGRLAEPGQKWNATDAIIDPTLPGKRLIWAAVAGEYYVVHYERGGIAHARFTFWLRSWQETDQNRRNFGAPLEVRSKITARFLKGCETGSWTIF